MNNSISQPSAAWPTTWPANSFRPGPTTLFVASLILVTIVVGFAGLVAVVGIYGRPSIGIAIGYQLVIELGICAAILIALPRLSKFSLRELGFVAPERWQIGIALLGMVAMVVLVEGGASLLENLTHHKQEQEVVALFKQIQHQPALAWFFGIYAVVLAPMMEEMIFRIFTFNLAMRYGGFMGGALISGLLFGAAHSDFQHFDWIVPLSLCVGGIVLASVYYRTRNAFCSMITHGCFNGLTVLAIIYAPQLAQ